MGITGSESRDAMIGAKKKPLASRQTMALILDRSWVERMCDTRLDMMSSVRVGSRKMGKISANGWPWRD